MNNAVPFEQFPWLHKLRWFVTESWTALHYVPGEGVWDRIVEKRSRHLRRAVCGLKASFVAPGLFSRMGSPRCKHCCKRLGIPNGKGSGLNAKELVRFAGACVTCNGGGKVIASYGGPRSKVKYKTCGKCGGSGWAKKTKKAA